MTHLRLARLWHGIGWALILAVIVLSLMPEPPVTGVGGSDKLGHALSYGVLMIWFTQLYPRAMHGRLALAFVAMGLLLEFLQALVPPRSFDPLDMAANGSGVVLGWIISSTIGRNWLVWVDRRAAELLLGR
jgi:VanZ family protein